MITRPSRLIVVAVFSVAALLALSPHLNPGAESSPSAQWEKDIQAFEAADRTNPPPPGAILFIGSSNIRLWNTLAQDFPEYTVINRGFGGSQIADAIEFADRIVIPYRPRLIVLGSGGNDINAGKSPQQVLADFQAFVAKVRARLPATRIAFQSLIPSPARWAQVEQQKVANQLLKDYIASARNLDYLDVFDLHLGPDGRPREELYVADKLHNNAEGYRLRAIIIRSHLDPPDRLVPRQN